MSKFAITPAQLEAIEKSVLTIVGDDKDKIAKLGESFTQLRDTLVVDGEVNKDNKDGDGNDDEPDADEDDSPMKKGFLDLYAEVAKVAKKGAEPALQAAFDKAFAEINTAFDGGIEAAFAAGEQAAVAKGGSGIGENDDMETVMKKLPAQVAKAFEDIKKANTDLTTKVEKLQTERDTEVFAKKAVEIGEAPAYGETLRKLHAADPKSYEEIVKTLTSKNAQIKKSGLFTEVGGGAGAEGSSAIEKLNGHATEIRKANKGMTQAKAFVKACEEHPDLYVEHKREQRA